MSKKKEVEENNILLVEDRSQYYTWILISTVLFVILIVGAFLVNSYAIFDGISKRDLERYYVKRDNLNFNDLSYDIRKEYVKADAIDSFNRKSMDILKEENAKLKKDLEVFSSKNTSTESVAECKNDLQDIENFNVDLQKEIVLLQNQLKSLEPYKSNKVVKKETYDKMQEKYNISIQEIEIANLSLQKELVALQKKLKNIKDNRPNNPFSTKESNQSEEMVPKVVVKEVIKEAEPKIIVKEVIKEVIKYVPVENNSSSSTKIVKDTVNDFSKNISKKRVKVEQFSCQDFEIYEHKATPACINGMNNLLSKYDSNFVYEIIPTINEKDKEIVKDYKYKSQDYIMRGLAQQRVNEARNLIIDKIGKEAKIKRVGYYINTKIERGFIVRVLK
jgi:hypothetical protein